MTIPLTRQEFAHLAVPTGGWLYLWTITKNNGDIIRFCDASTIITIDGETYTPVGSPNASAREDMGSLDPDNRSASSYLDVDAISEDDLRAGFYRNATVVEEVTSLAAPWVGRWTTSVLKVVETRWNGLFWDFEMEDASRLLQNTNARTAKVVCDHDFGGPACGVDLSGNAPDASPYTSTGTVTAVDTDRIQFTMSGLQADDWYRHGTLEWLTGDNTGQKFDIRQSSATTQITLAHLTSKPIQIGDTATVVAGCDGRYQTCVDRHQNGRRFGGFPFIPGIRAVIDYPPLRTS